MRVLFQYGPLDGQVLDLPEGSTAYTTIALPPLPMLLEDVLHAPPRSPTRIVYVIQGRFRWPADGKEFVVMVPEGKFRADIEARPSNPSRN